MKQARLLRYLLLAIVTGILGITALYFLFYRRPVCILYKHYYEAGTVSSPFAHDIWLEYGGPESRLVGIYRDFDGDGLIDEHLMFFSSKFGTRCFAVARDGEKDGILNIERSIIFDPPGVERRREQRPDEQPLTREYLDALARKFPRFPPPKR